MTKEKKESKMKEKVEEAIKYIRPSLQGDGGDVELVEVTEEGIVKVRLMGACSGCMMSQVTLKSGIENYLKQQVPEVKEVVAV
jgi:Fe-S cluster biogenesis protein NfuA